ncbi:MAG: DUF2125 domain-containing protein [Alphaproteobacteria bacterium]|nr:MAG: DUF2125 domain-containing protein [Alphaproteobacteria bacterium]
MRLRLLVPALAAILLAYVGYWFYAAGRFEDRLRHWQQMPPAGIAGSVSDIAVGGFPFRLEARFTGLELTGTGSRHQWRLTAPHAVLTALPWRRHHMVLEVPDADIQGHVAWPYAGGTKRHDITAHATVMGASLRQRADGQIARLSIDLIGASGTAPSLLGGTFTARDLQFHMRTHQPDASDAGAPPTAGLTLPERLELVCRGRGIALRDAGLAVLGSAIETFTLVVGIDGDSLPARTPAVLARWREAGGTLAVKLLAIDWGPLSIEAEGDMALDEALRPIGAFVARGTGFNAALDELAADGDVAADAAQLARLALNAKAAQNDDGKTRLEVPVSLQDGYAYLGPVPLVPIGPVVAP